MIFVVVVVAVVVVVNPGAGADVDQEQEDVSALSGRRGQEVRSAGLLVGAADVAGATPGFSQAADS